MFFLKKPSLVVNCNILKIGRRSFCRDFEKFFEIVGLNNFCSPNKKEPKKVKKNEINLNLFLKYIE